MIIRGLTLWRPWAAAIARGPKRVENRPWRPGADFPVGSLVAIHAGRTWSAEDAAWIVEHWPACSLDPEDHPAGVIVGLTEVVAFERNDPLFPADAWSFGPWCWRLGRTFPLARPVRARGAQGLWVLDPMVEHQLLTEWSARWGG